MEKAALPEEIIEHILTFLPVKSLIRFTCVSKRFRSIILSDPKFAQSQFQAVRDRKTLDHRLLYSIDGPRFESLDLKTPSFGDPSSVRKLKLPFPSPSSAVVLLGSCNGIVFLAFAEKIFYMWNPSTGFFKKIPHPGFSKIDNELLFYGVGYLPAADDYRVLVVSMDCIDVKNEGAIYSSKAHAWKTLEADVLSIISYQGTFLKEALHWLDTQDEIEAFDLTQQEEHKFRKMLLPRDFNDGGGDYYENHLGVSAGGYLSLARNLYVCGDSVDIWVMGEYGVRDSWTKRFNLKFSHPPRQDWNFNSVLVLETTMVAEIYVHKRHEIGRGLVKIGKKEEDTRSMYKDEGDWLNMIQYQESLLRIED
uniref:F-box/kelch-repeat protein At3g06240-like isoform X4 n=1 Tax=Fragaria vesca subsp. vesca TaxID=101020 RepID=UPI0005C97A07|nr:PREDICTED: F-box/kelch-repeat protein At3g06240-like isoform X4 [Fragaria vesca subsp. vesca]